MDLVKREITAETITPYFEEYFGHKPTHIAAAPGRVNLIGEHTDYNNGFVMPMALENHTVVAVAPSPTGNHRFCGSLGDQIYEIPVQDALSIGEPFWSNYVRGVLALLDRRGIKIGPVDMLIDSNVPRGGGLSSSAALEVSVCTALAAFAGVEIDPKEVALIGQSVEHEFVNVPCGIMDQFAIAMGKKDCAIFLDTSDLKYEYAPVKLEGARIVISCSNKKRGLGDSKYNERRSECETALAEIQKVKDIKSLGELTEEEFEAVKDAIKDPVRQKRAKHAVYENQRTVQAVAALKANDIAKFGELMNASHVSLRDDYEVTGIELDTLVEEAWNCPGVIGSRMTGAGFGGCTVSIVKTEDIDNFIAKVGAAYKEKIGYAADFYVVDIGDGAGVLK